MNVSPESCVWYLKQNLSEVLCAWRATLKKIPPIQAPSPCYRLCSKFGERRTGSIFWLTSGYCLHFNLLRKNLRHFIFYSQVLQLVENTGQALSSGYHLRFNLWRIQDRLYLLVIICISTCGEYSTGAIICLSSGYCLLFNL